MRPATVMTAVTFSGKEMAALAPPPSLVITGHRSAGVTAMFRVAVLAVPSLTMKLTVRVRLGL